MGADIRAFIRRWEGSSGSERGSAQPFLAELCDVLGVPRPEPPQSDPTRNRYVFEYPVQQADSDGKLRTTRIDLYKAAHFLLEAKQGAAAGSVKAGFARRDRHTWHAAMHDAYGQALGYARCLPEPVPILVVCDIGHCFDLYACFDGSGNYRPFPNHGGNRLFFRELERHVDVLRKIFTDPKSLKRSYGTADAASGGTDRTDAMAKNSDGPQAHFPAGGANPFEAGSVVPAERFIGRHAQKADLQARIGGISAQCGSIVGLRRSGKSSLCRHIVGRIHDFCLPEHNPLVVLLDLQAKQYHEPAGLIEGLRRCIKEKSGAPPWRAEHNDDPFAVDDGLAALRDRGIRLIVLLDEFERIGARLDRFQDWGEDWRAKASAGYFALGIATMRPLPEVYGCCGLTSPFGNIFSTTTLGALLPDERDELVFTCFQRVHAVPTESDLALIDELAGHLPYYVQLAGALLWRHRHHNQTREAFRLEAEDRFRELWLGLTTAERHGLRCASGITGLGPADTATLDFLMRNGLVRPDGRPFSRVFADFCRKQP